MADLAAPTPANVKVVKAIDLVSGPASEPINAGQLVGLVAATGQWALADADLVMVCRGIAVTTANQANISIDVLKKGIVDIDGVADAMDYGADVFPSDTAGLMADAVVNAQPAIGYIVPGWGTTTADKLLRVDL